MRKAEDDKTKALGPGGTKPPSFEEHQANQRAKADAIFNKAAKQLAERNFTSKHKDIRKLGEHQLTQMMGHKPTVMDKLKLRAGQAFPKLADRLNKPNNETPAPAQSGGSSIAKGAATESGPAPKLVAKQSKAAGNNKVPGVNTPVSGTPSAKTFGTVEEKKAGRPSNMKKSDVAPASMPAEGSANESSPESSSHGLAIIASRHAGFTGRLTSRMHQAKKHKKKKSDGESLMKNEKTVKDPLAAAKAAQRFYREKTGKIKNVEQKMAEKAPVARPATLPTKSLQKPARPASLPTKSLQPPPKPQAPAANPEQTVKDPMAAEKAKQRFSQEVTPQQKRPSTTTEVTAQEVTEKIPKIGVKKQYQDPNTAHAKLGHFIMSLIGKTAQSPVAQHLKSYRRSETNDLEVLQKSILEGIRNKVMGGVDKKAMKNVRTVAKEITKPDAPQTIAHRENKGIAENMTSRQRVWTPDSPPMTLNAASKKKHKERRLADARTKKEK